MEDYVDKTYAIIKSLPREKKKKLSDLMDKYYLGSGSPYFLFEICLMLKDYPAEIQRDFYECDEENGPNAFEFVKKCYSELQAEGIL